MKFNLPSSGTDQVNFQLSGFHEMPEFHKNSYTSKLHASISNSSYGKINTKPGRSVPKFNVKDLPQGIGFDHELFKSDFVSDEPSLAAQRAAAIEAIKKDSKKGGGTNYGVRSRASAQAQAETFMSKLRSDVEALQGNDLGEGETFMSDTVRIRRELMNVKLEVKKDVERDVGFGFR
jgi:hypothetical protein